MKLRSRKEEGAVMLVQNNDERTVRVVEANTALCSLLGYEVLEEGALLESLLSNKSRVVLDEDLEFEEQAPDLCELLSRHRTLSLRHRNGRDINVQCKIMRAASVDRHPRFRLVVSRPEWKMKRQSLSETLQEGLQGYEVLDEATQLPNTETLTRHIDLTSSCLSQQKIDGCFVYMVLEGDKRVGEKNISIDALIRHVGHVIRRNLRQDDVIGRAGEQALGVVLVEINTATIHMALSRLPHLVNSDPFITEDGTPYVPHIRQSCILLDEQSGEDVIGRAAKLLQEDPSRDMVMFRDATKSLGMFGS
jgi:GGDEF domain-containing protein